MTLHRTLALALSALSLLVACGDDDADVDAGAPTDQVDDGGAAGSDGSTELGPDAIGTIELDGDTARIVSVNDPYYEGMALTGSNMVVEDGEGRPAELEAGARAEVYLEPGSGCRESHPAQCDVARVVVRP